MEEVGEDGAYVMRRDAEENPNHFHPLPHNHEVLLVKIPRTNCRLLLVIYGSHSSSARVKNSEGMFFYVLLFSLFRIPSNLRRKR